MLTPTQFQGRADVRFADNEFQNITEQSFREFAADLAATFVAQAVANVPDYEPGRNYAPGFIIRRDFGGVRPVFLAALAPGGFLPAPTNAAGDASWELSLSPATGPALSQVGTVAALRYLQGDWMPGRLYILTNRLNAQGKQLPDVYVRALSEEVLEPEGHTLDAQGTPMLVEYDLATDTTTAQLGREVNQQQALKLAAANKLGLGSYIVLDYWNRIAGGVVLTSVEAGAFGSIGYINISNKHLAVVADLASLTYELLEDYITRLAKGNSQVPSEQLAQHTTSDGLRGTGPFQFRNRRPSGLALTIISNVAMVAAQVNYRDVTRDGIWIPGQVYTSTGNSDAELADLLADVEADIAAVPAAALAIAAEVIFRTQPIDAKLESDFFLSGLRSGAFFGRASFFRTSYTGPPIGQVLNNPQFTDASGWDVPYGGATLGGGAANLFGRSTGDHLIELHQAQTIQSGDYFFELEVVQLDKGSVTLKIFQNGSALGTWPVFAVGRFRYDVTLPTSGPYDVYLHSFDAGIIISHVYLVPK